MQALELIPQPVWLMSHNFMILHVGPYKMNKDKVNELLVKKTLAEGYAQKLKTIINSES